MWKKICIILGVILFLASTFLVNAIVKLVDYKNRVAELEGKINKTSGITSKNKLDNPTSKPANYKPYEIDENTVAKIDKLEKENNKLRNELAKKGIPVPSNQATDGSKPSDALPNKIDQLISEKKSTKEFMGKIYKTISVSDQLTDDEYGESLINTACEFLELTGERKNGFVGTAKAIVNSAEEFKKEMRTIEEEYNKIYAYDPENYEGAYKIYEQKFDDLIRRFSHYGFGDFNNKYSKYRYQGAIEKLKEHLSEDNSKHKSFLTSGVTRRRWLSALLNKGYYDDYNYPDEW